MPEKKNKRDLTTIVLTEKARDIITARKLNLSAFVNDMLVKWDYWIEKYKVNSNINIIQEVLKDITVKHILEKNWRDYECISKLMSK